MNLFSNQPNSRFSPTAQNALIKAGWISERIVPETQLRQWYVLKHEKMGGYCRIFPAALKCLKEFGGLHIKPPKTDNVYETVGLRFIPTDAQKFLGEAWFTYEWILETSLYPLGVVETSDHQQVIAVDQTGRIFSFYDELTLLGNTLDEAIENCLAGSDSEESVEFSEEKADEAVIIYNSIISTV